MAGSVMTLAERHRHELERGSSIDPAVIAERGYRTIDQRDRDDLTAIGIRLTSKTCFPGLLLPMFRATGERISAQFKPATPIELGVKNFVSWYREYYR